VPLIMASDAYQNHGMIVLWWDESEGGDTPNHTLPFIVMRWPLANTSVTDI
jgi:hypothetical protein